MEKEHTQHSQAYQIKPGYSVRRFLDEYLAVPVGSFEEPDTKVAVMNPVGQFIWEKLETEKTFDDLVNAVTEEFDVLADEAREDIEEFLEKLKKYQLLQE